MSDVIRRGPKNGLALALYCSTAFEHCPDIYCNIYACDLRLKLKTQYIQFRYVHDCRVDNRRSRDDEDTFIYVYYTHTVTEYCLSASSKTKPVAPRCNSGLQLVEWSTCLCL